MPQKAEALIRYVGGELEARRWGERELAGPKQKKEA